jgi:hypothetical protein
MSVQEMAFDTLATMLRILGEYALDQEQVEAAAFTQMSEQWAQHVLVASPAPGTEATSDGRRDWAGVREFARDYCRNSSRHTTTVIGDLRQVIWVFIQNLNQTLTNANDTDTRIKDQLSKLETLAQGSSTSELKKQVLATVVTVAQMIEERKKTDHSRVETLGAKVRSLGEELESARKERGRSADPAVQPAGLRCFSRPHRRAVARVRTAGLHAAGRP